MFKLASSNIELNFALLLLLVYYKHNPQSDV